MSSNSVVILDNISLDLPEDVIAELTKGLGQVDGMVLETNQETTVTPAATPAAATPAYAATPAVTPAAAATSAATPTAAAVTPAATPAAADDDWFRAGPSSRATPRGLGKYPSSGRKNMKALLKSLRSPSPTPSIISTQSSVAGEEEDADSDEYSKFLEEEQRRRNEEEARRAEWRRCAAGRRADMERKWVRARELISSLTGEGKRLKNQREALRAQQLSIDAQLRALDDEEGDLEKRKRSAVKSERKYGSIVAKYREMNL